MTVPDNIFALEEGIRARLVAKIPGVEIGSFPDDPAAYRLRHQRGALLVGYRGGSFERPLDHDEIAQFRTMTMAVLVFGRALNGHQGAYAYLEAVRAALVEYDLDGFEPLAAAGEAFLGHDEGVWMYELRVETRSIALAVPEDEVDAVIAELLNG